MKSFKALLLSITLLISCALWVSADYYIENYGGWAGAPTVRYDSPWLEWGIEIIKDSLWDIETERSASAYIQDVVEYLLTFLALIAVIYIIYAGFNIMIWNGDEEKLKKSRQTIIYVLLWLVVIFLAWPITLFILNIINVS